MTRPATSRRFSRSPLLLSLALAASILVVYFPARHFAFIALDDADYVADNSPVQAGLTWESVRWAFTTTHACNWHPITWLSHLLDTELFGSGPAGPHLTNIVLHAVNGALLLLLLHRLTRSLWRSAWVAVFFALHPLRIESVAWIAERKDVLSSFFFILTLHAYANYARPFSGQSRRPTLWYVGSLLLFALGLMSKPMLVTLPFVLLLLDYWPLDRLKIPDGQTPVRTIATLLREKIPFFFLSAASCIATLYAQHQGGAVRSLASFTLLQRLENTFVAHVQYLGKTFWPVDLAIFYPHPGHWPPSLVIVATLIVAVVSFATLRRPASHPYAAVGWLWFVGMLFPTIGLVQVGDHSMADRYTYLPSIGLFIFLVWGAAACIQRRPETKPFLDIFAGFCLVGLILLTRVQLPRWQESERLFRHALAVTQNNFAAHHSLGYMLLTQGRTDEAIAEFQQSLSLHPQFAEAHNNLGNAFLQKQQPQEAIVHYELALTLQPRLANAHYNLGTTLLQLGRLDEARRALTRAVELQPDSPWPLLNLGNVFLQHGDTGQAIACYQKVLARKPDLADAHDNLGHTFQQVGRTDEAIHHFQTALKISPNHANAHYHLGDLFLRQGRADEAARHFQQALTVNPADADTHNALAIALLQQHHIATALTHLESALKSQPDNIRTLANLSWILATCPDDSLRQGQRAVSLAERAINLARTDDPQLLHTLAAAQAETGQFDLAISTAQKALQLSVQAGDSSLADALRGHLTAYTAHTPLRDASLISSPPP